MRAPAASGAKAPAVAKAISILDDLARSADAGSISAMARRIGAAKSSVADVCATLLAFGLLSRDRDGRYLLGRHIVELARGLVGGQRLIDVFGEACEIVPEARDETVIMSILDGADIVIVAVRHGRATLPITARIGLRVPAWAASSGRCFLAALPDSRVAEILASSSATSAGVSGRPPTAKQLIADLKVGRRRGYQVDDPSMATGMTSFSAPIDGAPGGHVVAAIAVTARTDSLARARCDQLHAAALAIAAACKRLAALNDDA